MRKKIAVVLFNLGGPDSLESVRPFLFNLFFDKAILRVPKPFRWLLAQFISRKRENTAREIYEQIGGSSPILKLTKIQAESLEKKLLRKYQSKVFIAMRHWHPMTLETALLVKEYNPTHIILLPLYPQFSTTTSGSSILEWEKVGKKLNLKALTKTICCFPINMGWISAQVKLIQESINNCSDSKNTRLLFSAHGLPKKIIDQGDPYQSHVEATVTEIVKRLNITNLDWEICYQSRVGPLEWIGPSTELALEKASIDQKNVLVIPVAFVSDHSETLVELDIEYKSLADELGIKEYRRVPVVGDHSLFIDGLMSMIELTLDTTIPLYNSNGNGSRVCDSDFVGCPNKNYN